MQPKAINVENFFIEYRGKIYPCDVIRQQHSLLYRVTFPQSCLYLTKASDRDGTTFWTSIPEDLKLKHVVSELGDRIDKAVLLHQQPLTSMQGDLFND